jgi:arabinose-5-phosphate isomerase
MKNDEAAPGILPSPESHLIAPDLIVAGRAAVAGEASALWDLARSIDARFAEAIGLLLATRRRVVVTGLGKSGHIARKIAATFSATGTPASFLHAGDALHGDIGELCAGDTLLLLSNSGETRECCAIATHAATLGIPAIAITSRTDSALALTATLTLALPPAREICPHELSPTTSSTMMLALGDALATVLMRQREVSLAFIRQVHPGGRIGRDLLPIAGLMHVGMALPLVSTDAPMLDVLPVISAKGFGIAIVVEADGTLVGVITDGDLRRHLTEMAGSCAGDVLTRDPLTMRSDAVARDALALLTGCRITALVITDAQAPSKVVGLLHVHDLLRLGIS